MIIKVLYITTAYLVRLKMYIGKIFFMNNNKGSDVFILKIGALGNTIRVIIIMDTVTVFILDKNSCCLDDLFQLT
jgi:uncharacterized membrane protein YhfC